MVKLYTYARLNRYLPAQGAGNVVNKNNIILPEHPTCDDDIFLLGSRTEYRAGLEIHIAKPMHPNAIATHGFWSFMVSISGLTSGPVLEMGGTSAS